MSGKPGGGDRPNQPLYLYPQMITKATKNHCIIIIGSKRKKERVCSKKEQKDEMILRKQCKNSYRASVVVPCFDVASSSERLTRLHHVTVVKRGELLLSSHVIWFTKIAFNRQSKNVVVSETVTYN